MNATTFPNLFTLIPSAGQVVSWRIKAEMVTIKKSDLFWLMLETQKQDEVFIKARKGI